MKIKLILTFSLLLFSFVMQSQMCFSTPTGTNYTTGQLAKSPISEDFNNDGKPDVAIANYSSSNISILLGDGLGSLTSFTTISSTSPSLIESADFNNDGNKDIISVNYTYSLVSVYMGNGTGNFTNTVTYTLPFYPKAIYIANVNADSNIDLIITGITTTNNVKFYYGDGAGNFSYNSQISTNGYITDLIKGDFNNDGKFDFATCHQLPTNLVTVYSGNGAGNFNLVSSPVSVFDPKVLTNSDYNEDGILDLAVISGQNSDSLSILLGTGSGGFTIFNKTAIFSYSLKMINADYNNDGHIDLTITNPYSGFINILYGNGTGQFNTSLQIARMENPTELLHKDFNTDGFEDLLFINSSSVSSKICLILGTVTELNYKTSIFQISGTAYFTLSEDFDNDGNPDIAVAEAESGVSIIYGDGSGNATAITAYGLATGIYCLTSGDFNNDGLMDIAASSANQNSAQVLINNGNREFTQQPSLGMGSSPFAITKGDFNHDGNLDIVTANSGFNNVTVRYGDGLGAFPSIATSTVGSQPMFIVAEDFNNDGYTDIVTSNNGPQNMAVLISNGGIGFASAVTFTTGGAPKAIASADFNNDGNKDIAVANYVSNKIVILLGNGLGNFNISGSYNTTSTISVQSMVIKDFNMDGKLDIIVAHENTVASTISILSGNGSGSFATAVNLSTCQHPYGLGITDFNNDEKPDLLVTNKSPLSVSVLFNQAPTLSLNSSSVSVCAGNLVTLTASGATTYTWSNGVSNGVSFTPTSSAVYTVTGSNSCGNAQATASVSLIQSSPTLTAIASSSIVCYGTSAILNALGANSYTWTNGVSNNISFVPLVSNTYTVTGENLCGVSTATIDVTVDPTCQDVWPGDANSDGFTDNLDVLELGLHYTQTGTPRATQSNAWQSYFSNNWTGTITNGKNMNHSDCNGDGTINDDDTLAIYNNYGLTHAFKTAQTTTVNPQLSIVPDQPYVIKGTWGTSSIYLGDASANIVNINGVAFTVDFDNTLIEPNSIWIEYPTSFINSANQNLHFRKLAFANSKLFTATTHTVNNNVSGFGKIAILHYKIKSSLVTDEVLNIGLSLANQSDVTGIISPLTAGTETLMAIGASVGLQELNGNVVSVSPNPTNGPLIINSKAEFQKIEVVSVTGQVLLSETPTAITHTLHLENFANGIYFVNVYQNNRIVKREKVVLNK
ncbi:MAG: T9SS type A sorting domain-containing protein [Bacteroidetes bacterium]|nr:T9SS type A sorting domain-containing protein [Bacteroidota bacterium]